jgi:hypothetical protein
MADIKVLYVNSEGFNQESNSSTDSIQMFSFKTATKELTDTKLSKLIDGVDANDEHIHDARYFRQNQYISSSAGIADANKPIYAGSAGKLDTSLLDVSTLNALLSHSALTNLSADDHVQYSKADGSRDFSGAIKYASHPSFSLPTQLIDKKYVDDLMAGTGDWMNAVLSRANAPASSPVVGARYLVDSGMGALSGAFVGNDKSIAQWSGSAYVFTVPHIGNMVSVDNETDGIYLYDGTSWSKKSFEATSASTGLTKVGMDIQLASSAAGSGLSFLAGVLSAKFDNLSVDLNGSGQLEIKDIGVKAAKIDFGVGAGQVKASLLPIVDVGNYTAASDVEGAIQDLYMRVEATGVDYLADLGGVTKGQPVVISSADKVGPLGAVSNHQRVIGIASDTVTAGARVQVLMDDAVIPGVLSGAVAGATYYWSGTGLSTTMPSSSGSHVWKMGVAKNATDLHVQCDFIKVIA